MYVHGVAINFNDVLMVLQCIQCRIDSISFVPNYLTISSEVFVPH
jgi:hypothetical protein